MSNCLSRRRLRLLLCGSLILFGAWRSAVAQTIPRTHRAEIKPSIINVKPGKTQRFKAIMTATRLMAATAPEKVSWSVNDIPGGNEHVGTIDEAGLYRAPSSIPSPREIHVGADVPHAANRYLFATVVIGESRPEYKSIRIVSEPLRDRAENGGHLSKPHGIGLDADGNVMIADENGHSVHRYTPEGKYLGQLGHGPGEQPGHFKFPRVATIDDAGQIYVTDSKGDKPRIQVFDRDGKFLRMFAEKGVQPGMILRAHGMDFDSRGRLYTVDVDNMRVNVYGPGGEFLDDWGSKVFFQAGSMLRMVCSSIAATTFSSRRITAWCKNSIVRACSFLTIAMAIRRVARFTSIIQPGINGAMPIFAFVPKRVSVVS